MDDDIESINVVPLVDADAALLTIVLTTATFGHGPHPVDLAQSTQVATAVVEPVVITLTRDLQVYVNDQPTAHLSVALAGFSPCKPWLCVPTVRWPDHLVCGPHQGLGLERVALEPRP